MNKNCNALWLVAAFTAGIATSIGAFFVIRWVGEMGKQKISEGSFEILVDENAVEDSNIPTLEIE